MVNFTYDEDVFSDLYKDVNGFRPRGHEFYSATPERKQEIWDFYCQRLNEELERLNEELEHEREMHARAIKEFEAQINEMIELGAGDRETALRWLVDSHGQDGINYGYEFIEYRLGLPYGYLSEMMKEIDE